MAGVDRAIVFSLRYGDSIGVDGDDEVTARACARYPDKLIGFAAVDPRRPDCMELLEHAIEDLHLEGAKFGPIYNGVSVLDERMAPVLAYLERNNLPLTMHMGTTFAPNAPIRLGRPLDVDEAAARHPDLKMVMAHLGHPWVEECVVIARKNPNVYCEVSALYYRPWQFWNALVCVQEYGIATRDKVFWGTDFPFTTVEDSIAGLTGVNRVVEGTGLPRIADATIEAILHSNPLTHWWHGGRAR
jgi:predicted TIM-barrel fold metal-dependent hydrolase